MGTQLIDLSAQLLYWGWIWVHFIIGEFHTSKRVAHGADSLSCSLFCEHLVSITVVFCGPSYLFSVQLFVCLFVCLKPISMSMRQGRRQDLGVGRLFVSLSPTLCATTFGPFCLFVYLFNIFKWKLVFKVKKAAQNMTSINICETTLKAKCSHAVYISTRLLPFSDWHCYFTSDLEQIWPSSVKWQHQHLQYILALMYHYGQNMYTLSPVFSDSLCCGFGNFVNIVGKQNEPNAANH